MARTYKRKHARNPDRRMAAVARLRAQGLSLRQIAQQAAVGKSTVARDLARWDQEHPNVTPLVSQKPVPNLPRGGDFGTPEWDSEPTNVIELRRRA